MPLRTLPALLVMTAASAALSADPWEPPAGFYDAVTGTGATLKGQLYDRMRTGHTQRTYGDFRFSAALHDADPDTPGNIILVYNDASVPAAWDSGATWNREHVWPQSLQPGSASNSTRGNLGDPHALRPANPSINSSRSNRPFGFETTTGSYGFQGAYYFTGDTDKGDIARMLFYSETRYGPELGLTLTDSFPSSNQMGDLSSLIAWHYLDPPDTFERRRNHVIFSAAENPTYFTNNRNAYIDHPEYVWSVYVDQANDSRLWVGVAPDADGGSVQAVDLGGVIVGTPAPGPVAVTLHRDGVDGVYYEVISLDGATCPAEGRFNAFAIGGATDRVLTVGAETPASSGEHTAFVMVDNLDVTTGGGPGRGALDADDVVAVDITAYERAEASFATGANTDVLNHDFGTLAAGAGDATVDVPIFNLDMPGGLVADLELAPGPGTGDTTRLTLALSATNGVEPGSSVTATLTLVDGAPGSFSADYTVRVFDDASISGAGEGTPLMIHLTGTVSASVCAADLDSNGAVDATDLALLLTFWGDTGPSDLNADGTTNGADLALLIAAWGPCDL